MKNHIKVYFKHFKYDISSFIECEVCKAPSNDIHHIQPKGMGGSKTKDNIENLIALCRDCHNDAHDNIISKWELKEIINQRK